MDWDTETMIWPIVYLLSGGAVLFFVWGLILRNKRKKSAFWLEIMTIAVFCLLSAILIAAVNTYGLSLSYTARIGLVAIILALYARYLQRRQNKPE